MVGVEAGGEGIQAGKHAAVSGRLARCSSRHRSYLLQDEFGQVQLTHSVSAGLDYAAVARACLAPATATRGIYLRHDDKALELS